MGKSKASASVISIPTTPISASSGVHVRKVSTSLKQRKNTPGYADSTTLAQMKRTFRELVGFLFRDNSHPNGCLLMTGTGIVPPKDFTLLAGDTVSISIGGIGTLINTMRR